VIICPKCSHRFPEAVAKQAPFEYFHVLVDQYAIAQGLNKVEAKDSLCVLFGISKEYEEPWEPPKYPGVFCRLWGRMFFRKSTLAYSPNEMSRMIQSTQEAIHTGEGS
jgi:hypothetical protein